MEEMGDAYAGGGRVASAHVAGVGAAGECDAGGGQHGGEAEMIPLLLPVTKGPLSSRVHHVAPQRLRTPQ